MNDVAHCPTTLNRFGRKSSSFAARDRSTTTYVNRIIPFAAPALVASAAIFARRSRALAVCASLVTRRRPVTGSSSKSSHARSLWYFFSHARSARWASSASTSSSSSSPFAPSAPYAASTDVIARVYAADGDGESETIGE